MTESLFSISAFLTQCDAGARGGETTAQKDQEVPRFLPGLRTSEPSHVYSL